MSMTVTTDCVIVGLGAYGSAVLYQLARRGIKAVGIDRYQPPHSMGSSHGETRITRLAVGEGEAYAPLVARSHEIWRDLERETGDSLMLQTGVLIMAPRDSAARHHGRESFVNRSFAVAERFGIAHERLDAAGITARFPQFELHGDEVGYYEPSGGMLRPEACVTAQLRLASRHGAVLRYNEQVLEVRQDSAGVRIVTSEGVLQAAQVILTAGPWMADFLPQPLRPLVPVYRQTLHWFAAEDPVAYTIGRFPVFIWMHGEGEEDYFYGFPTPEGTKGVKVASETYAAAVDPNQVARTVAPGEPGAMYATHVAGRLRGVGPLALRSAACLYTVTPDSGFIVDCMPGQDRVLAISACSGHGFKHSAAVGEAITQRLADGHSNIDLSPFLMDRFRVD